LVDTVATGRGAARALGAALALTFFWVTVTGASGVGGLVVCPRAGNVVRSAVVTVVPTTANALILRIILIPQRIDPILSVSTVDLGILDWINQN
jgi:hypothetical protein